jgi:hypothetical protein
MSAFARFIVQGGTNKVDSAKRKHCMRSEHAVAITLVLRKLGRQILYARSLVYKLATGYLLRVFV